MNIKCAVCALCALLSISANAVTNTEFNRGISATKDDAPPTNDFNKMKLYGGDLAYNRTASAWVTRHSEPGDVPFIMTIVDKPVQGISLMADKYSYCYDSTWYADGVKLNPSVKHNLNKDSQFSLNIKFNNAEWDKIINSSKVDFYICNKPFSLTQNEIKAISYMKNNLR